MKEGAAKLLAANRNPGIALEAGKSLLTSTARLNAYMNELQAHKALCATEGTSHRLIILFLNLCTGIFFCVFVCEAATQISISISMFKKLIFSQAINFYPRVTEIIGQYLARCGLTSLDAVK